MAFDIASIWSCTSFSLSAHSLVSYVPLHRPDFTEMAPSKHFMTGAILAQHEPSAATSEHSP